MNVYFIVLLLIATAMVFISMYMTFRKQQIVIQQKFVQPTQASANCEILLENLIPISNSNTTCCFILGENTGDRWYSTTPASGYLLADAPTYYLQACATACAYGYDNSTLTCNNDLTNEQTTAFKNCINLIAPKNCIASAIPFARLGTDEWYIKSTNAQACNLQPCGTVIT